MSPNADKRKCSAVCKNGNPCRAWALVGSDPPLCTIHAGKTVGVGGQWGNQNALKHGLYADAMRPRDREVADIMAAKSVGHELVLARAGLLRLAEYLGQEELALAELLAILPVMSTMLRTVAVLVKELDGALFDWDEILDDLRDEWGGVIGYG